MNEFKGTLKDLVLAHNAGEILREMKQTGQLEREYPELLALDVDSKHHKNNFEHSIKVLENAKELAKADPILEPTDTTLLIAALYHDVGKPATFAFEGKKATFRNHEYAGATMMNKILKRHKLSRIEISEIKTLIANHMRGHTFAVGWTDSAIRRLATEAGSVEQIHRLGVIFGSDATTRYENKRNTFRRNALELRDAMLEVVNNDKLKARRPAIDGHRVMELTGLSGGEELGSIMRFLNSEEGLSLTEDQAVEYVLNRI